MQLSHIHLPSFTLVLTSGNNSLYVPAIPDNLMKTIDLRDVPDNFGYFEDFEFTANNIENMETQTIFELERPTSPDVRRPWNKQNLGPRALIHKFLTLKAKLARN